MLSACGSTSPERGLPPPVDPAVPVVPDAAPPPETKPALLEQVEALVRGLEDTLRRSKVR